MKQFLTLLLLLCSMTAVAQDVIAKNNKQIIKCRIVEVTDDEVSYNKWEDLNGRTYVLNRADVFSIERDENIDAKIAEMDGTNAPAALVETPSSQVDDEHLKRLDAERHPFVTVKTDTNEKKRKRLKWTAIGTAIATPIVAVVGIACVIPAAVSIGTGIRCAKLKKGTKRNNNQPFFE